VAQISNREAARFIRRSSLPISPVVIAGLVDTLNQARAGK
jgi:hypothetical protein